MGRFGPRPFAPNPPLWEGEVNYEWKEIYLEELGEAGKTTSLLTKDAETLCFLASLIDASLIFPEAPHVDSLWHSFLIRLGSGIMETTGKPADFEIDRKRKVVSVHPEQKNIGRYIGKGGSNIKRIQELVGKIGWKLQVR